MNSLEYIEKEIKQLEERKEKAFKNEYYGVYKECSQKITTLQQIKSELEAWEELTTLFYITIDNFGNLYISLGEETVDTLYERVSEKYINSFKKALEVEDES